MHPRDPSLTTQPLNPKPPLGKAKFRAKIPLDLHNTLEGLSPFRLIYP